MQPTAADIVELERALRELSELNVQAAVQQAMVHAARIAAPPATAAAQAWC